ncbi:hypothetical protein WICMUC_001973 [Wickerhamomyces mucosus]|uniref:RNA polymerase II holoenzyme cyclin-like subunit n=1 Tax=Wickerhamomyces mucosus TaxID=1378264 RepID=A0A9P8PT05_9ASCO|nr:hypothetical protein WICMUC_001973 [Wickerhamomyces mucosus]
MAADYWTSTQRMKWQFTRDSLKNTRLELIKLEKSMEDSNLISKIPMDYDIYMRIYIHSLINKLGRRLNIRQIALSTAEVYLMRFLTKVILKEINLYLLVTTSIYLACKLEECPQHIRTIVSEARNLWPEYIPHDITKIAEFEFYLIEELDTYLIVHHPYKTLLTIDEVLSKRQKFNKPQLNDDDNVNDNNNTNNNDNNNNNNNNVDADDLNNKRITSFLTPEELQTSWSIINDSYVTDLLLLYPPHIVATASIYLTIVLKYTHIQQLRLEKKNSNGIGTNDLNPNQFRYKNDESLQNYINFLGYSNIDLEEVIEAVQELITLYEAWESYDEVKCKKTLEIVLLNRS